MNDLHGLHIIVTRPRAQAEPWAQRLIELGAAVTLLPLMEISAVESEEKIRAIKNCILDFDSYSKAIFVSQNAVEHGFEWLENYWPQLPMGIRFFAVGDTTAKLLQSYGVSVTDLAQAQDGAMTSETLLQSPELQQVADEKILIFRGVGGRTHLGEVLSVRGAKVDYCELYDRCLPQAAIEQFKQLFRNSSSLDLNNTVVALHSGEAFSNLVLLLNQLGLSEQMLKQELQLLVPSARVAEQANTAGFNKIYTAENATDNSMLQRLMSIHSIKKGHVL